MIVLSSSISDLSTSNVIDWLHYHYEESFFRMNNDNLRMTSFDEMTNLIFRSNEIKSVWNRKLGTSYFYNEDFQLNSILAEHAEAELEVLRNGIIGDQKKYNLGSSKVELNKIHFLKKFNELELDTPPTLITTKKSELIDFIDKNGEVIVKPMSEILYYKSGTRLFKTFTERINDRIDFIEDVFFPSMFQKYIDKLYEIRTFFLDGEMYSMAIFSQANKKTSVDFRKYDRFYPNRNTAFQLPSAVTDKLRRFMAELNLNIGVFDIIKSIEGKFVFLEVNPWGQFGDISMNCNYYLEKKIANCLTRTKHNEQGRN